MQSLAQAQTTLNAKIDGKKVLVACSTGVDSTVLLDMVINSRANRIVVVHVNHQKREQSELEEKYIKDFCKTREIPCYVKRLDLDYVGNFQNYARSERYKLFKEVMKKEKLDILLTAHHADDNLETILMRIIRTSSLKGYAGILSETFENGTYIYRPLLKVNKSSIYDYAKNNNIKYFEDSSNFENDYTRNRIRHQIVPLLLEENPTIYDAINDFSDTIQNADLLLEEKIKNFINESVTVNNKDITFNINDFLSLSSFLRVQILFRILKSYKLSRICIDEVIKQIAADKQQIVNRINSNLWMIKEYGQIHFINNSNIIGEYYLEITKDGEYHLPNNAQLIVNKNICYFKTKANEMCYNIKELPIIVRSRKDGDKIKLQSGSKKVSDFLTTKKIAHFERMNLLLLCNKNNEVLEMLGLKYRKPKY